MRNITADMQTEFEGRSLQPALFGWFEFDSGNIGMWTGYGDITWDGKTFLGGGDFIGISTVEETQDLVAKGLVLSLNGVDSALTSVSLTEHVKNRPFRLYLGLFANANASLVDPDTGEPWVDPDTGEPWVDPDASGENLTLVADPYRLFSGRMDTVEFTDGGKTADLRMNVENILYIGQRAKVSRYTDEHQRKKYPTDTGLSRINNLQDKEIVW